jgi:hypothetical protein
MICETTHSTFSAQARTHAHTHTLHMYTSLFACEYFINKNYMNTFSLNCMFIETVDVNRTHLICVHNVVSEHAMLVPNMYALVLH